MWDCLESGLARSMVTQAVCRVDNVLVMVDSGNRLWADHLSSCPVRHKVCAQAKGGIMNITGVMGLWDSFIAVRDTISQGGVYKVERTRQPMPASSAL